jgi:hypothetical protein
MFVIEAKALPVVVETGMIQSVLPDLQRAVDGLIDRPERQMLECLSPIDKRIVLIGPAPNHV